MEEFEMKFLDINVSELEDKLLSIGAKKVKELNYIRTLFDYEDLRLNSQHSWFRLRTDGEETTLTFKQRIDVKSNDGSIPDGGMKEIEVVVDSYDKTHEMLKMVGLFPKIEERNKRIRYEKDDVVYDIDFWPQLPPYIEIESSSMKKVELAGEELGFNPKDGLVCSAKQVYKKYGIDKDQYSYISFEKMIKK